MRAILAFPAWLVVIGFLAFPEPPKIVALQELDQFFSSTTSASPATK